MGLIAKTIRATRFELLELEDANRVSKHATKLARKELRKSEKERGSMYAAKFLSKVAKAAIKDTSKAEEAVKKTSKKVVS